MRLPAVVMFGIVATAIAATACSDSDSASGSQRELDASAAITTVGTSTTTAATSTTVAPTPTTTPTTAATTTSSRAPGTTSARGPASPAEAARGFYDAWQARDRTAAARFAQDAAIAQLLSMPGGGMTFAGCRQTAGDLFDCAFRYEGGALHMYVYGDAVRGHKVEEIRFNVD